MSRPGLKRIEEAWRVVSLASVAKEPVIVITPALPPAQSPATPVLKALTGSNRPIAALVQLGAPDGLTTLRDLAAGGA